MIAPTYPIAVAVVLFIIFLRWLSPDYTGLSLVIQAFTLVIQAVYKVPNLWLFRGRLDRQHQQRERLRPPDQLSMGRLFSWLVLAC